MKKLLIFFLCLLMPVAAYATDQFSNLSAKQIIVKDLSSGQVLLEKNADQRMPTSSMSKVMTMYMVFDALKAGKIGLNDKFKVSEKARAKGGSRMFLEQGSEVSVEALSKGVIVQSGNDATIVLAEGLSGSETAFAVSMNEKAKELGLNSSRFMNASGWPDPDHYSTARDLATLGTRIITDFPEFYGYYSLTEFEYNKIKQRNRNPLLFRDDMNVDGIKTGHTDVGGYGLMASGTAGDRRVVLVMNGMKSERARVIETAKVMRWALESFKTDRLTEAGETIRTVPVAYGHSANLSVGMLEDLSLSIPLLQEDDVKVTVNLPGRVEAPIKKGDVIGTIIFDVPDLGEVKRDLLALEDVGRANFISRFFEGLSYRVFGV